MLEKLFTYPGFVAVGIAVGFVMIAMVFMLGTRRPNSEKLSPYECGFEGI